MLLLLLSLSSFALACSYYVFYLICYSAIRLLSRRCAMKLSVSVSLRYTNILFTSGVARDWTI